jgi:hypothetical protein
LGLMLAKGFADLSGGQQAHHHNAELLSWLHSAGETRGG